MPSAGIDILYILWNPKVHCSVHNSLLQFIILSRMNLVHKIPSSDSRSSKQILPFVFPHQRPVYILFSATCATCSAHLIFLYLTSRIIFG